MLPSLPLVPSELISFATSANLVLSFFTKGKMLSIIALASSLVLVTSAPALVVPTKGITIWLDSIESANFL